MKIKAVLNFILVFLNDVHNKSVDYMKSELNFQLWYVQIKL